MSDRTTQSVLFQGPGQKPLVARFDTESQSSDGGLVLLKQLDQGIGLTSRLAQHLIDGRQSARILHSSESLFQQRVFGLCAGYEDCNDSERVRSDPVMKMVSGRDATGDDSLGSQPTLSRFENAQTGRAVVSMQQELETFVIDRVGKRHRKASTVMLDFDSTCDKGYGTQQYLAFSGFYKSWCFLPLLGFLSVDGDPDQYLFTARLRTGTAHNTKGLLSILRRVIPQVRKRFPDAEIRVRLDAGFATPRVFEALEEHKCKYLVGMAKNSRLDEDTDTDQILTCLSAYLSGESEKGFGELQYKTKSWKATRRVIYKVEALMYDGRSQRENRRFVVTNLEGTPEEIWQLYAKRGDSENRIKELKNDLWMDRTSCRRILANQLRVLMAATAYVLFQELRWRLRRTELRRAQVHRLRNMLIKLGVRVVESTRRIVMHFSRDCPWKDAWVKAAKGMGAVPA